MDDIVTQAEAIAAQSPRAQAERACEDVSRFIRHGQVDGKWGEVLDVAYLAAVAQYTMPDGQPVYQAVFATVGGLIMMLLAPTDGGYVKLPPDGSWGHAPTIG